MNEMLKRLFRKFWFVLPALTFVGSATYCVISEKQNYKVKEEKETVIAEKNIQAIKYLESNYSHNEIEYQRIKKLVSENIENKYPKYTGTNDATLEAYGEEIFSLEKEYDKKLASINNWISVLCWIVAGLSLAIPIAIWICTFIGNYLDEF
ncbi:hypothetical protein VO56_02240 [Mycoplasmopsis gallinacea]|uniref:Uncharacterized protein n=1 Tax=Mycoplasmopsis gallinacea TaxID=29556 RepID=A0A0D5ZJJ1_9BACT|nr:hypothetical protein VO56_02240 [Mycoplasmopsis gallinacea]